MADFHLMHVIPHPSLHGLYGYKEVIDTISWGLEQLGHRVTYGVNQVRPAATNIIFGAQMLPLEEIPRLPPNTICYTLEQVRNVDLSVLHQSFLQCAERFVLWDYASVNVPTWQKIPGARVKVVPIGYAPILSRIRPNPVQDIDVLLYGMAGIERLTAFHQLSIEGMTVVFVSGLYGQARDELIARAKIVLNVNLYRVAQIFEVVRVSYLLANAKAVVTTKDPDTYVEEDLTAAVEWSTLDDLVAVCRRLLDDTAARTALEARGRAIIARRDIRAILSAALDAA